MMNHLMHFISKSSEMINLEILRNDFFYEMVMHKKNDERKQKKMMNHLTRFI